MQVLREYGIVTDVVERIVNEKLQVNYRQGRSMVELGNMLTPTETKNPPILKWPFDPNVLYFICMIDPDMPHPQRAKLKEYQHWAVGNIPGDDVALGDVLTAYVGPIPPQDGGIHRYVFLAYRQNKELGFDEQIIMRNEHLQRSKFNLGVFARKNQLGEPLAINFFRAQYDNQVDIAMQGFKDLLGERSSDNVSISLETSRSFKRLTNATSSIFGDKT